MTQNARPTADDSLGNYTVTPSSPSTGYDKLDESSLDTADYIESPSSPSSEAAKFTLGSITDPESSSNHVLHVVAAKDSAGGERIDLTVKFYSDTTVVATRTFPQLDGTPTDKSFTLTSAETDAITAAHYAGSLKVEVIMDAVA